MAYESEASSCNSPGQKPLYIMIAEHLEVNQVVEAEDARFHSGMTL